MSVIADYKFYVDWNNDMDFGDANEDITSYVLQATWSTGSSSPPAHPMAGVCQLKLNNGSSIFSSYNSNSPIYGSILPGRMVKVTMAPEGGAETDVWFGYLETIEPIVGEVKASSTAKLVAYGALAQFVDVDVDMALQEDITTGAALDEILDQVDFPLDSEGFRDLDVGETTLLKWWINKDTKALSAIYELVDAELGTLIEGKDGKLIFRARDYYFNAPGSVAQSTYGTGTLKMWNLKQSNPLDGIYNEINGKIRTFNKSDDIILINLTDVENNIGGTPIVIPNGETKIVWLDFNETSHPSNQIGVDSWSLIDYEANTAANGSGTDITTDITDAREEFGPRVKVTFTNNNASDAHLVVLRAHGVAVIEGDPILVNSKDATSQSKYRKRLFPYPSNWLTEEDDAENYCDHIVAAYKDPRPQLYFEVIANYDSTHMTEVRERAVGDRINVNADEDWGLYINEAFIIDKLQHAVDDRYNHVMKVWCTIAPTEELGAMVTTYSDKVEPTFGPPDDLYINGIDPAGQVVLGITAWKNNADIFKGEFRAKYVSDPVDYVDMRTSDEGGTFADNGSTQLIISNLAAGWNGVNYMFQSSASSGRWYYTGRLQNTWGWSVWSDGNPTPSRVTDFVDLEIGGTLDTGRPEDSTVEVQIKGNTAVVSATRPAINAATILTYTVQLRDAGAGGSWRALDADTGAADTRYDGSGENHVYDQAEGTLTRASGGWGTASRGDLILVDVYNDGGFDVDDCTWGYVGEINGDVISGVRFRMYGAADSGTEWQSVRLKIVKRPDTWTTEGYLGNTGYWQGQYYWNNQKGDKTSDVFVSDPMPLPSGMQMRNIVARVWFENKICTADCGNTDALALVDVANPSGASGLVILRNSDDPSITPGMAVLQWYRDTANYENIYVAAFWFSSSLPAHGPFYAERDGAASTVIEEGTCTITLGSTAVTVTRAADAGILNHVMVVYTDDATPDSDIDGEFVAAQDTNSITLDRAFQQKDGEFDYAIVKLWWPNTITGTGNSGYVEFSVPDDIGGDIDAVLWRTTEFPDPGDVCITGASRNPFGLGQKMTYDPDNPDADQDPSGGVNCETLTDGATISLDARLASANRVYRLTMSEALSSGNRMLENPTGSTCGQLIVYTFVNTSDSSLVLELDTKFRNGQIVPGSDYDIAEETSAGDTILTIPADTQAYFGVRRDVVYDTFDIVFFRYNYILPVTFPECWAYWKLDETSGDRVDSTGNGHDLSEDGSPTYAAAKIGNGLFVDASTEGIKETATAWPCASDAPFTIVFWTKPTYGGSGTEYPLEINSNVGIYLASAGSYFKVQVYTDDVSTETDEDLTLSAFHLVVIVYDGTDLKIYVDNVEEATATGSSGFSSPYATTYMGYPSVGGSTAIVDEAGIWLGAFDADQRDYVWNDGDGRTLY